MTGKNRSVREAYVDDRYPWLDKAVQDKSEIITASRRLARDLGEKWAEHEKAMGKTAWLTPRIVYIEDWLSQYLIDAADSIRPMNKLDRLKELMLWEGALARRIPDEVLGFGGIVKQLSIASSIASEWLIPYSKIEAAACSPDEELFVEVLADYKEALRKGNWVDSAGLPEVICELLSSGKCIPPKTIVVAGFHRVNPALGMLFDALRGQDSTVTIIDPATKSELVVEQEYLEERAEFRSAGAWAAEILNDNSRARIAIICPRLESKMQRVSGLVREGLLPGWQFGSQRHQSLVNVGYGRRLIDFPAVGAAMLVLRWLRTGIKGEEVSVLLRSNWIGGDSLGGRARLEAYLRSLSDRDWDIGTLRAVLMDRDASLDAVEFVQLLDKAYELSEVVDQLMTPHQCVQRIDKFLNDIGWPGDVAPDSLDFQLNNRWRELLNELAKIEGITQRIRLSDAINRLESLTLDTLWQPETLTGSVQLLGPQQAAGMEFDAIWIAGMDSSEWPPKAHPSSFISRDLQRSYGVSDATPADTLDFSEKLFSSLVNSSPECVLSWSRIRDGTERDVSAMVGAQKAGDYRGAEDPGWSTKGLAGTTQMLTIPDDVVPPVTDREKIWGGAYTVQRQKSEPFSGFVYGRLGVRHLEPFSKGLTPSLRGSIVHSALYTLLRDKPSRADLGTWDESKKSQRINGAADSALDPYTQNADDVLKQIIRIERDRLKFLLEKFLISELRRPEFQIVGVEAKIPYSKFGVDLGFRVDRIDQLADGRMLIIDYKTGQTKTITNNKKEIREIQPVLYADALDADISGLLLLNVNSSAITPRGVGSGWAAIGSATAPGWQNTLEDYIAEADKLVEALGCGDARVNIGEGSSEGANSLALLSRIAELKNAG